MTEATASNYWISSTALSITLNAMGDANYIQANAASGAMIMCYMRGIEGLGYDNGHNYRRWPLVANPTYFNSTSEKYVYAAIPRKDNADNATALIVYPSERVDVYGKSSSGIQVGSVDYYYIFLGGIISASVVNGILQQRTWSQRVDSGKLASDEAIANGGDNTWWIYNAVDNTVAFLKTITKAVFDYIETKVINLSGSRLTSVADDDTSEESPDAVVTPVYLFSRYLRKDLPDIAQKLITFLEGVMIGNEGYRIRPNGDAVLGKITSLVYDAVTQRGFGIEKGKNGYKLSITDIEVWGKAIFNNLELRKLSYVGGNYSFSPAGSKIAYVKWIGSDGNFTRNADDIRTFRCYVMADDGTTATRNMWTIGEQARCDEFDVKEGNSHGTRNRHYWRLVTDCSTDSDGLTDHDGKAIYPGKKFTWVDLGMDDASSPGDDFPQAGDTIVARGHRTDERRQGFIDINTHGDDAPSIVVYSGVNSYQLNDSNITALLSPKDIRLSADKLRLLTPGGRFMSLLDMTRNEISLAVNDLGGTNMLHGTAFTSLPPYSGIARDAAWINHDVTIGDDASKRHLGRNYIRMECLGSSEPKYTGIFYKVDVEPDTDYTVSVWVMTDDISSVDTLCAMELICLTGDVRGERLRSPYITPTEEGVWKQVVNTVHVPAGIRRMEVNFWIEQNGRLYLSEPQVERGRIATDWSENPSDADARALRAGINLHDGTINLGGENIIIDNGMGMPTAIFKDGKIKASYIESTVLTTVPDERGCYTEIYGNVFHLHGAKGKNGIKQYIDKDGMPHLVFYNPEGLPAFDMWWGNMASLFPGLIQAHWEECFVMSVQGQNGLYVVQNKNADYKVYEYHASYNTSSKKYGEDGQYNMMLFVEKDVNSPTIPDGWYIKKTVYGWYSEVPIQPSISIIKWVGAVTLISVQNGKLQKINNKDYIIQYFDFDNGYMIDGKLGYMGKTFGDGIVKQ